MDIKELLPLIFALSKFVLRNFPQLALTSVSVICIWSISKDVFGPKTRTFFKPLIYIELTKPGGNRQCSAILINVLQLKMFLGSRTVFYLLFKRMSLLRATI